MNNSAVDPFIFYLTLEEDLSPLYYKFNAHLKEQGFILLPIKVDQLQTLLASTDQSQVIVLCSVSDSREYKLYNEKVRGFLKYILKSKRITFMHMSSFSKLNDMKSYAIFKNYYFVKFPFDAKEFSLRVSKYYYLKLKQNTRWPGGRRAGVNLISSR